MKNEKHYGYTVYREWKTKNIMNILYIKNGKRKTL